MLIGDRTFYPGWDTSKLDKTVAELAKASSTRMPKRISRSKPRRIEAATQVHVLTASDPARINFGACCIRRWYRACEGSAGGRRKGRELRTLHAHCIHQTRRHNTKLIEFHYYQSSPCVLSLGFYALRLSPPLLDLPSPRGTVDPRFCEYSPPAR